MSLLELIHNHASQQYQQIAQSLDNDLAIGDYVVLYGPNHIEGRNQTYEVQTYMPGWVAIGDDGGGQAILIKLDGSDSVYCLGHGVLGSLPPEMISESLATWVENGCPMHQDDDELDDA